MQWFIYAIFGQLLYAVGFLIDKYLLDKYFKKRSIGTLLIFGGIFAGFTSLVVGLRIPSVISGTSLQNIVLMILGGVLISLYFFPYFSALAEDEASLVAPLFQLIPLFTLVLGYLFLGETLTRQQSIGGAIILMGAIGISYEYGRKFVLRKGLLYKMVFASLLYSIAALYFKYFALETNFWSALFWGNIGTFLFAIVLFLVIKSYRQSFYVVIKRSNLIFLSANAVNEITYVIASILSLYAALLGPVALVQTTVGFHAFFVLIFSILLTLMFPWIIKENISRKHLLVKFFFILVMTLGIYVLYK